MIAGLRRPRCGWDSQLVVALASVSFDSESTVGCWVPGTVRALKAPMNSVVGCKYSLVAELRPLCLPGFVWGLAVWFYVGFHIALRRPSFN